MSREYRIIVLTPEEAKDALASFRRIRVGFLPDGPITRYDLTADGVAIGVHTTFAGEVICDLSMEELTEALVMFCLDSNIKLPRAAKKRATVTQGALALEMTLDSEMGALEEATSIKPAEGKAAEKARKRAGMNWLRV
jgi:hypothetical protein